MSETQPISIDRLTGEPYTGPLNRTWTIAEVREEALKLGKPFRPADDTKDRLEADLANGALVLFDQEQVESAVEEGWVPSEWQQDLIDLVTRRNDIAVIPSESLLKPDEDAE